MKRYVILLFLPLLSACGGTDKPGNTTVAVDANLLKQVLKVDPNDPLRHTMTPSQLFSISGATENVIEGKQGTTVYIPKAAFRNAKGEIVEKDIKIELIEATTLDDLIRSGLQSADSTGAISSDGVVYLNATANGEQLSLDKNSPLHIERPLRGKDRKNLLTFQGLRDSSGQMHWLNPQQPENTLTPIPLSQLDFIPEKFVQTVNDNLPFRNHKTLSRTLCDSLYWALSAWRPGYGEDDGVMNDTANVCGIDPASAKVLQEKHFQKTLISTREFERRFKAIVNTCNENVLNVYVQHLQNSLWQNDSMAANLLKGTAHEATFRNFASERLGKVRVDDQRAKAMDAFYSRRLDETKAQLARVKAKRDSLEHIKDVRYQQAMQEYDSLLVLRQNYRLEHYGFVQTSLGWTMMGSYIIGPSKFQFDVEIPTGNDYDRSYVYIVNPRIQSIFGLLAGDKVHFTTAHAQDHIFVSWMGERQLAVAVSYKGEQVFTDTVSFTVQDRPAKIRFSPKASTKKSFKDFLAKYDTWKAENKISVDLYYEDAIWKEQKRQEQLRNDYDLMVQLWNLARPCCPTGRVAFK